MGAGGLPADWQAHRSVSKPMSMATLADALGGALRDQRQS
jgi:hypothetical protein